MREQEIGERGGGGVIVFVLVIDRLVLSLKVP